MIARGPAFPNRVFPAHAEAFFVTAWATAGFEEISLQWESSHDGPRVVVSGLEESWFARHERASWKERLAVHPETAGLESGLPPMLGKHAKENGKLVFTPLFPLQPGLRYRASFSFSEGEGSTDPLTAAYQLPEPGDTAPTVVSHIHPSAKTLPENLLKFYVHFSAPMSRGHIYEHIHLTGPDGKRIELPFLEIDEELWDPTMTRVTLFIDPGRIKRGVKPLEEIGPALEEGKAYTLTIDAAWRDARQRPLKESHHKLFRVGPPDRHPPEPTRWVIASPPAGGTDPLDHALALRMIHVIRDEMPLEGPASLVDEERGWRFAPSEVWKPGAYEILVQTAIEDLAGNNVGKPFEVDLEGPVERQLSERSVRVGFTVDQP